MISFLFSIFDSKVCSGCKRRNGSWVTDPSAFLCDACQDCIRFFRVPAHLPRLARRYFRFAFSVAAYEGVLLKLTHDFKYRRRLYLAKLFTNWLARLELDWKVYDALVPLPQHWTRTWGRGFNPAEVIAWELSQRVGLAVKPNWLRKVRRTKPQVGLKLEDRLRNVRGSFGHHSKRKIIPQDAQLLLIDDVLTTGATVNECAKVLTGAGAKRVDVLTLARAL